MKSKNLEWLSLGAFFPYSQRSSIRKPSKYLTECVIGSDRRFPIIGGEQPISRELIFDSLWNSLSTPMAVKYFGDIDKMHDQDFYFIWIGYKIFGLTEVLAYVLSDKKPRDLGSKSKSIENRKLRDNTVELLNSSLNRLKKNKISKDLKRYFPTLESEINELIEKHNSIINNITNLAKREKSLVSNAAMGFYNFKRYVSGGFSDHELRRIIDAAVLDLKNSGYEILRSKEQLKQALYYQIDDESFFKAGPIQKRKPNKK